MCMQRESNVSATNSFTFFPCTSPLDLHNVHIYVCVYKMLHMSYEAHKKSQRINLEAQDICEL